MFMNEKTPLEIAQLIVRGNYINIDWRRTFMEYSAIYRFTNEDISSYFHHLQNKKQVLTVIGSGCQVLNGILAGIKDFDCFDISIFPEYYLYLQIASILALSKEDYLKYHFSEDKEELFSNDFYEKISEKLSGKYKEFWDTLYMFDDGIDIYHSLLFRHDLCSKQFAIETNPFLQENNYEKLKYLLQTDSIHIQAVVTDITKKKFFKEYDLIHLSNILSYHFKENDLPRYIQFLKEHFFITPNGEIINYFFDMKLKNMKKLESLLKPNGYVENLGKKKLLVYKK